MKRLRELLHKERAMLDASEQLGVTDPELETVTAEIDEMALTARLSSGPCYGIAALSEGKE